MTVSIANLTASWVDTGNAYTGIGMNVAAPFGANTNSRLINLSVNGTSEFSVDANGKVYCVSLNTNTLYTNNYLASGLPSASGVGRGTRAFIVDCSNMTVADANGNISSNYGGIVSGGGGGSTPVYSDGTNWRIG
jgi:hypothetical protein